MAWLSSCVVKRASSVVRLRTRLSPVLRHVVAHATYISGGTEPFDAVLTDIEMPRMDGFTLTERLRQQENYRTVPIIIVTSREKPEDKRRGVQVGADAYIVKGDFDQNNLIATLRALLG